MGEIIQLDDKGLVDQLQERKRLCDMLRKTPHYYKIGDAGIFAIVEKARSIGMNPLEALNGSMYFVNGKVELSSTAMNNLIRQKGHSITKDKRSNDQICILHGRRKDNGDTWVASFSIDEAKRAGIFENKSQKYPSSWQKYPLDMLFARALSRLARQLFPDVINGCYVEGEIEASINSTSEECYADEVQDALLVEADLAPELDFDRLEFYLEHNPRLKQNVETFLMKKHGASDIREMPQDVYNKIMARAEKEHVEAETINGEQLQMEG